MKRILFIILILTFLMASPVQAATVYFKTGISGGTATDLDGLNEGSVSEDDMAVVAKDNNFLWYVLQESGETEDQPWIVAPDGVTGNKRWHLKTTGYNEIGRVDRPLFEYVDADEIDIGAGGYHLDGIGYVQWDSALNYTFTTLATNDWSYLYIDQSAVVTAGNTILTLSEFVDSNTEPTWSATKKGWYNGDDRCIFAVFSATGSAQIQFLHNGGQRVYHTPQYITGNISTNPETFSVYIPVFSSSGLATIDTTISGTVNIRIPGTTTNVPVLDNSGGFNTFDMMVNSSQQIVFSGSTGTVEVNGVAFDLGPGL